MRWHQRGLVALIAVQWCLGLATWVVRYQVPQWLGGGDVPWVNVAGSLPQALTVTAHVAIGSLILAVATLWGVRLSWPVMAASLPVTAVSYCATGAWRAEVMA